MRKLFTLLLLTTMLISCSSDDNNDQDYTSFVVTIDATPIFPNCVAAYRKDDKYYKLGDLGDLTKGKYSTEIRINDNSISEIYIFTDYLGTRRFDATYKIHKNKKNTIVVGNGTKGIEVTDKLSQSQYPQ